MYFDEEAKKYKNLKFMVWKQYIEPYILEKVFQLLNMIRCWL